MSTSAPPIYSYYQPYASNAGYNTTNNPRQLVSNADEFAVNTGGQLLAQQQALANQYGQEETGVQNYLAPIEGQLAAGQGGYNPTEASQIELTPKQQQDIVTSAGISAGQGNAAAVNAAERAYAATGGNPAALATYRARAAQSEAANAGQAETGAKVAAQQAGSAGAQAVGNARIGQQDVGLNYFGNLQSQLGQERATEAGLGNQTYGTETGALTGGLNAGINASQTPTTADKIIGGIAGAAGAIGLADGTSGYLDDGQDAVVGENGMEAVIEDAPKAVVRGASDPVRSDTTFMADGSNNPPWSSGHTPTYLDTGYGVPGMADSTPPPEQPLPAPQGGGMNAALSQNTPDFGKRQGGGLPVWLQQALANKQQQPAAPSAGQPGWNKTTPYTQLGAAVGKLASPYINRALNPQAASTPAASPSAGPAKNPLAGATTPGDINAEYNRSYVSPDDVQSALDRFHSQVGMPQGDASIGDSVGGASDLSDVAPDFSGGIFADGRMPQYLDDGAPEQAEYRADPENSSEVARLIAKESMAADGKMMSTGHMGSGFHWSNRMPHAPHVPTGGYQPLHYDAKPMLADGSMSVPQAPSFDPSAIKNPMAAMGATEEGREPQNGEQVGRAKIFTKPTLIHLEKADAVVPLSYRPKAKVRPSAALPALMAKPQHRFYGARA